MEELKKIITYLRDPQSILPLLVIYLDNVFKLIYKLPKYSERANREEEWLA